MGRMNDVEEMLREMSEKYKNSKSVEVYEEQLEGWFKLIDDLREENKKLNEEIENHKQNIMQDELEIIPKLEEENKKLKSDLSECECSMHYENDEVGFWKREMKKHKPCLIKEEYVFNLCDYDYQILTSTTPQLKIIKKSNKGASTFTIDGFTAIGKTFSSLADEEDLYEDIK